MNILESLTAYGRKIVRLLMRRAAVLLNTLSGGHLRPNHITVLSLLGHIVIAYLVAARHPIWAGGLLVVFGLMDAIDGELARLQKRDSSAGMLFDSISDRVKEVLLYIGASYFFVVLGYPYTTVWAIAACGASLLVSYVNAWGEVVMTKNNNQKHRINQSFRSGLMSYDVRMFLFFIGLMTSLLPEMLIIISVLSFWTAFMRLVFIIRKI